MTSRFPHVETPSESSRSHDCNNAEKGQHDSSEKYPAPPCKAHVCNRVIVDDGLLSATIVPKIDPLPKKKVSKTTLFALWLNTYRQFFIFIMLLNLMGMILASIGKGVYLGYILSGASWLVCYTMYIFNHRATYHDSVLARGIITSCFIIISVLSVCPNYHNNFQNHHRFAGWLGLAVIIRYISIELGIHLSKVTILCFNKRMQQGLLCCISKTRHYRGDFTRGLITNPLRKIWLREIKFTRVRHASTMFKRGIRIYRGTGIGAALSIYIQSKD
ncbi:hypothetical protein DER46DRAFT_622471 [Fusarium sp. MPI-SDFR-AT-0072]|nr:hypothetical protein DER46DRAFT_622471 [Fusarium sp. MPI-SDFR-AT-0072]